MTHGKNQAAFSALGKGPIRARGTGRQGLKPTLSQKHFLGSKYFKILHENFRDMGGAVLGGGGGHTFQDMGGAVLRYGRCCFEIWEVLYWGVEGGHTSRDMGGAVLGGGGGHTFRDMGGAVSRYWRCCFMIWEVLK